MTQKSLSDLAHKMRGIDIAMLSTRTDGGQIATRPMSNNADVDYDGNSYYFTWDRSRLVKDIERDAHVSLAFSGKPGLHGADGLYIAVEGEAEVIRNKSEFEKHWIADLDAWFDQGADTPGLVMVKVHAERVTYWEGAEQGEIKLH
jgi:general stress protein 26